MIAADLEQELQEISWAASSESMWPSVKACDDVADGGGVRRRDDGRDLQRVHNEVVQQAVLAGAGKHPPKRLPVRISVSWKILR